MNLLPRTADEQALEAPGGEGGAELPRLSRRNLLLGGAMVGTALATYGLLPRKRVGFAPGTSIEKSIPIELPGWPAAGGVDFVLPPADEVKAAAIYQQILTRAYRAAGAMVMLLIAYDPTQTAMLHIHRPDTCYPSAGFKILAKKSVLVDASPTHRIPAKFLSARSIERTEQVLYWTRLGDEFPRTFPEQRRSLFWQNMHGYVPDGALVRLSVIHHDADAALDILHSFARSLFAGAGAMGRELLAGPAIAAELGARKA